MRRTSVLVNGALAALLLIAGGCSAGGDDDASTTTEVEASSTSGSTTTVDVPAGAGGADDGDAICPDSDDLENVVGGPVDTEPTSGFSMSGSLGGSVSFKYKGCDVELTEGGQGRLSITRITAAEVDGESHEGSVFGVLRDAASADFDDDGFELLAELGVEAYRDGRTVAFLADDVMVFVEVEVDGEESLDAALEMTAALAASPDPIPESDLDCAVLGALAPDSFGDVADVSVSGGTTVIGDLQFQRTGCGVDHTSGYETSISVAEISLWQDWVAAKEASTFSAFYTEVEIAGKAAFDDGEQLVIDDGDSPWVITASGDDLDPDPAGVRLGVAELALGRN